MSNKIYYAVISLTTNDDMEEVSKNLSNQSLQEVSDWFIKKKSSLYGKKRADWKPFNDEKSIHNLFNLISPGLSSLENIIENTLNELENDKDTNYVFAQRFDGIDNVNFVIDVFVLFSNRYKLLLEYLDTRYASGTTGKFCIVLPYGFNENHSKIFNTFKDTLYKKFAELRLRCQEGKQHRIVTSNHGGLINYIYELDSQHFRPILEKNDEQLNQHFGEAPRRDCNFWGETQA